LITDALASGRAPRISLPHRFRNNPARPS